MDDGYKEMVLSSIGFKDETKKALESEDFTGAMDKSIDKWKDTTSKGMGTTKENIDTTIGEIKKNINSTTFDPLSVKFGDIKLPHFNVTGGFDLAKGQIPKLSIEWYDKGGLFDSPQIIGIAEKRPEFVGAKEDLETFVRRAVSQAFDSVGAGTMSRLQNNIANTKNIYGSPVTLSPTVQIYTKGNLTKEDLKKAAAFVSREFAKAIPTGKTG